MRIKQLINAGKAIYGYTDEDLDLLRKAYASDPSGLESALASDPCIKFYLEKGYWNEQDPKRNAA